ncbi:hypothetical protein [Endozoicomonas sp. SCSIO W0465]|uniref:hypothetical protein n=1 Tax=Endozoicomonas sp. SCSIO W0465 TaxID=2918516 RepID=UPI0020759A57|nr:hypothetical protein [Endozoicomonas sp. SCSIO W0465]USE34199.1 hypothetical protein MJO57_18755 [Endozoicomonas sp. SCSIO W0465]
MDQINRLPSFDASFSYLYSSALGLVDQEQQFGTTEQQPIYQGIAVQVLNPISIYNSEPDTYQNEANHSNSLNKYNIESLTNFDSENAPGTSIQEIQQSILDEYVPYQPDYEPVNDGLLLTPGTPFQQLISWDEIEIREQTTANHTSSGLQLTNLSAGTNSSQDLRPVAVVSPLCMHQATSDNQTTQAEVNVEGSSSLAERKRECQRKLRKDPASAEGVRERNRKRQRERRKDPAYAERERERERERKRELRKDPAYLERQRARQRELKRELRKDPDYRKRERERKRELRKDPAYRKRERERQKQYRQSVNSAKNSGDLPLTSNLTERTQSSSKNSEGTVAPLFSRQAEGIFTVPIDPLSHSEQSAIEG